MDREPGTVDNDPMRVKLIFNPLAGTIAASGMGLVEVIHEMQVRGIVPEVYLIEPECDLPEVIEDALARGIETIVVCGGDGTISSVARALLGKRATLGIIPGGTRNNIALSLDIPSDVPAAVALLRAGRLSKVDVGVATVGETETSFMEVCSVGLASALFPSADDIQHGNLARVGDFLATLVGSAASQIRLMLDDEQEITGQGHVVLVSNMPYVGPNYQIAEAAADDGLLDVLLFAEQSKLDLLGHVIQTASASGSEDPRVQRYRARSVDIQTKPAMAIMVDGVVLGEDPVHVEVRQGALLVHRSTKGDLG